jgi:hypothetical protein
VDNGYSAELMLHLDSLGYAPDVSEVQMALVVFDPDGYQHPMNSYDTTAGSFYKSWWGSEWGGSYRTVLLEPLTGVAEGQGAVPTSFSLAQNYPNPFNPSTTIRYAVPQESFVTIVVYDLLGRPVRTVVSGDHTPGSYAVTLNADGLASGMYLYRMTSTPAEASAGLFTASKRLMLLK